MFGTNVTVLVASIESLNVIPVGRNSTPSLAFLIEEVKECVGIIDVTREAHSTANDGNWFVGRWGLVVHSVCSRTGPGRKWSVVAIWYRIIRAKPIGFERLDVRRHLSIPQEDSPWKVDTYGRYVYLMSRTGLQELTGGQSVRVSHHAIP